MRNCKNCRFWEYTMFIRADRGTVDCGLCRRKAPILLQGQGTCWPVTHEGDWCGEFELKSETDKRWIKPLPWFCGTCGKDGIRSLSLRDDGNLDAVCCHCKTEWVA